MASKTKNRIAAICANVLGSEPYGVIKSYRKKFADSLVYDGLREAFLAGKKNGTWTQADSALAYYFRKKLEKVGIGSNPGLRKAISEAMGSAAYAQVGSFPDDDQNFLEEAWDDVTDIFDWGLVSRTKDRVWEVIQAQGSCMVDKIETMPLLTAIIASFPPAPPGAAITVYLNGIAIACGADSARVQCKIQAIFDGRKCDQVVEPPRPSSSTPKPPATQPQSGETSSYTPEFTAAQAAERARNAAFGTQVATRPQAAATAGATTIAAVVVGVLALAGTVYFLSSAKGVKQ
jgi:hypothetical protein